MAASEREDVVPGAWELREQQRVLCGILHVETTSVAWALALRNLDIPGPIIPLTGMPFDHARNSAVQHMLSGPFQWMFFLDSDVAPPRDAVRRLLAHRQPIVSGLYARRSPPEGIPVMLKDGKWIRDYQPNALVEMDLVGAGCLLVHREVFEKVPPQRPGHPWFDWRVNMAGHLPPGECLSEDFTWNAWVRKHGYRILVDTSIVCRHIGMAEATPGQFKPLDTRAET